MVYYQGQLDTITVVRLRWVGSVVSSERFSFASWCKHGTNLTKMLISLNDERLIEQVGDADFPCNTETIPVEGDWLLSLDVCAFA